MAFQGKQLNIEWTFLKGIRLHKSMEEWRSGVGVIPLNKAIQFSFLVHFVKMKVISNNVNRLVVFTYKNNNNEVFDKFLEIVLKILKNHLKLLLNNYFII